ncbi:23S rRNA (guanosine(2251)-2'-O)-methyltransferase RlmB [Candidatus Beckwithbacteria bacterium]|nr:23S rRNA (guanosine(2251)-2'-O)-methyltransferase RlmB [Candidatus Beckwithbacteria bacterium]
MGVKQPSRRFSKPALRQLEGRNVVREALRAQNKLTEILIEEKMKFDERLQEIKQLANKQKVPIKRVGSHQLKKLSKTGGNHQGIIAFGEYLEVYRLQELLDILEKQKQAPFFIMLTGVMYEHNLGAVIRTADAAGVHGVIISKQGEPLSPVVYRTAMGAEEHVMIIEENLFVALKLLKKHGIKLLGASEKADYNLFKTDLNKGICLIMGVEDRGLSEPIAKLLDGYISIPMLGQIDSLNMSVAAAIAMYEVVRQRRYA